MRTPTLIALAALMGGAAARPAVLYVDAAAYGPAHDGATWRTAFTTLQPAVAAAAAGDEVRVAAGTYPGGLTVNVAARIIGGYVRRADGPDDPPDPAANRTIIEGGGADAVTLNASATLDGFTVRGGWAGVAVRAGDPVITRCRLRGNQVAIDSSDASPTITFNDIRRNADGINVVDGWPVIRCNTISAQTLNGITVNGGTASIRDNLITGISDTGVALTDCVATVAFNTFLGNGTGLMASGGVVGLSGSIFYLNSRPIVRRASAGITYRSNCFNNNSAGIDGDPGTSNGNIRTSPEFRSWGNGDALLSAASPCINAADASSVLAGETDLFGRPRVSDGAPDMGAIEFNATDAATPLQIVRVRADTGNDANDGSSWDRPMKTLQAAIDRIEGPGQVSVAMGTYAESIRLPAFVGLAGGWRGTSDRMEDRVEAPDATVIDAGGALNGVTCHTGNLAAYLTSLTVTNAVVGVSSQRGYPHLTWVRTVNTLGPGVVDNGGGMVLVESEIVNAAKGTKEDCGAVRAIDAWPTLTQCRIAGRSSTYQTLSGIKCENSWPTVTNTLVTGFSTGLELTGAAARLVNVTMASNTRGIVGTSAYVDVANSIISAGGPSVSMTTPNGPSTWRNNDVYPSSSLVTGTTNISASPLFRDAVRGNYRLAAGSPCIDAGDSSAYLGAQDLDGRTRIVGARVDMGAYEYVAPVYTVADAATALRAAGGITAAAPDLARLDTGEHDGRLTLEDASRILRNAVGMD